MKLGFIGAGNMGGAILNGLLRSGALPPEDLYVSRKRPELSAEWAARGVHVMGDNSALARAVDCVVLAVKPYYAAEVLAGAREALSGKLVVSIVAGWSYEMLRDALPENARFVRVMPNTPLSVGEGMSLVCSRCACTEKEFAFAKSLFEASGKVAVVDEAVFTAANGISGCGPAFVCMFIEALADGGVRCGVPRQLAYELAAQTLIGSAKLLLETGEHPGELKDAVCSPGGQTIEGVLALERGGMRAAVMDAVGAAVEKNAKLARK